MLQYSSVRHETLLPSLRNSHFKIACSLAKTWRVKGSVTHLEEQ